MWQPCRLPEEAVMGVNSGYKDSVFSFLFSNPDTLRELYGAITGVPLPPDIPVTINTLEGVLYRTLRNDISFEVGGKLVVLIEHQSSINPNMAIRLLMYMGRVYEKLTAGRNIYGSKKLKIPQPEFIVLYNGKAPYPEEGVMRLSEAFEDLVSLGMEEGVPKLELEVKVYNINYGYNERMVRRSGTLEGYSRFIAKVRELEGAGDREGAMGEAVRWCIGHGVLKGFLEEHGAEVMNMLMTEWKLEDALVVEREEGQEEGWEKGREEAAKNLYDFGMKAEQISQALKLPLETVQQYINS
jgi:hypothetical protein